MSEAVLLPIEALRYTTKKRRGICSRRVEEIRQALEFGEDIPPIRVNALGDGTYVVKDGRHRIQAHLEAGIGFIYALVDNLGTKLRFLIRFFFSRPNKSSGSAFFIPRLSLPTGRQALFVSCCLR